MPSDNSQKNSGIVAMTCAEEPGSMTSNSTAVPEMMISGPPISPSIVMRLWDEAGPVHQVAEQQPVPDADDPAGPGQERPVMDRDERPADRVERGRVG